MQFSISYNPLSGNAPSCDLLYYFTVSNAKDFTHQGESAVTQRVNSQTTPLSLTDKQFLCCKICYKQVKIKRHKSVFIYLGLL
jgi:hypothetical protein